MNKTKAEREEAVRQLRASIKPGDTLYTVLRHVSRSGMQRSIDIFKLNGKGPQCLSYYIGKVCGYGRDDSNGGIKIVGCGMDMGFHIVHSLGYALYGEEAGKGTSAKANKLRAQIAKADPNYLTQGGAVMPDTTKPDLCWFGAAGYALHHRWL